VTSKREGMVTFGLALPPGRGNFRPMIGGSPLALSWCAAVVLGWLRLLGVPLDALWAIVLAVALGGFASARLRREPLWASAWILIVVALSAWILSAGWRPVEHVARGWYAFDGLWFNSLVDATRHGSVWPRPSPVEGNMPSHYLIGIHLAVDVVLWNRAAPAISAQPVIIVWIVVSWVAEVALALRGRSKARGTLALSLVFLGNPGLVLLPSSQFAMLPLMFLALRRCGTDDPATSPPRTVVELLLLQAILASAHTITSLVTLMWIGEWMLRRAWTRRDVPSVAATLIVAAITAPWLYLASESPQHDYTLTDWLAAGGNPPLRWDALLFYTEAGAWLLTMIPLLLTASGRHWGGMSVAGALLISVLLALEGVFSLRIIAHYLAPFVALRVLTIGLLPLVVMPSGLENFAHARRRILHALTLALPPAVWLATQFATAADLIRGTRALFNEEAAQRLDHRDAVLMEDIRRWVPSREAVLLVDHGEYDPLWVPPLTSRAQWTAWPSPFYGHVQMSDLEDLGRFIANRDAFDLQTPEGLRDWSREHGVTAVVAKSFRVTTQGVRDASQRDPIRWAERYADGSWIALGYGKEYVAVVPWPDLE